MNKTTSGIPRTDSEGKYIVTLPIKAEISATVYLGESREAILKQFDGNENLLMKKPDVKIFYDEVF